MTTTHAPETITGPFLDDPALSSTAWALHDVEKVRIAMENRVRQLTRAEVDEDGVLRGAGLTEDHPQVASLTSIAESLADLEKEATKNLQKAMKSHLLGPFVKQAKGVGEKQAARLLAAIGDPYWNVADNRPRSVSELWAYCGMNVVTGEGARRRKRVKSNWSAEGKMRAYLIATSIVKSPTSEYRKVYDERRAHTAVTRPDWTAGHSHNDALRVVAKAVLKDLWRAARDLHEGAA